MFYFKDKNYAKFKIKREDPVNQLKKYEKFVKNNPW